jgi:hypothetical protein
MLTGAVDPSVLPGSGAIVFTPSGHATSVGGPARSPNVNVVLRDLAVFLTLGSVDAIDQSGPHISCTVAGAAQTTCNSGTQTATLAPGSLLTVVVSGVNAPNFATLEYGYRATTP